MVAPVLLYVTQVLLIMRGRTSERNLDIRPTACPESLVTKIKGISTLFKANHLQKVVRAATESVQIAVHYVQYTGHIF